MAPRVDTSCSFLFSRQNLPLVDCVSFGGTKADFEVRREREREREHSVVLRAVLHLSLELARSRSVLARLTRVHDTVQDPCMAFLHKKYEQACLHTASIALDPRLVSKDDNDNCNFQTESC